MVDHYPVIALCSVDDTIGFSNYMHTSVLLNSQIYFHTSVVQDWQRFVVVSFKFIIQYMPNTL